MAWTTREFSLTSTDNDAYDATEAVAFQGAGSSNIQLLAISPSHTDGKEIQLEYSLDGVTYETTPELIAGTIITGLGVDEVYIHVLPQAYPYYRINGKSSSGNDVTWTFVFAELVV